MRRLCVYLACMFCTTTFAQAANTYCVSPSGMHTFPYTNWGLAATNIQTAVAVAKSGDLVLVTNGTYFLGNEVVITNGVTVQGLNGALNTIVDGGATTRCFRLGHASAWVKGLTIQNGRRGYVGESGGAGVLMQGGGVDGCVIRNNNADPYGGGGVYCYTGVVRNCLIISNRADSGGGVKCLQDAVIENCTIVANVGTTYQANSGGGVYFVGGGLIRNSIIYGNQATTDGDIGFDITNGTCEYVCTPLPQSGPGNITNDPVFASGADFRLSNTSPCLNAGTNQGWMSGAYDLAGNPRIVNGRVDMGAYESTNSAAGFQGAFSYTVDVDNVVSDGQITGGVFALSMSFYDENGVTANANYDLLNPGGVQILTDEPFAAMSFLDFGRVLVAEDDARAGYYPGDLGVYTARYSVANSNSMWVYDQTTLSNGTPLVFAVVDDDTAWPTGNCTTSGNLLVNPGFETNGSGWIIEDLSPPSVYFTNWAAETGDWGLVLTNAGTAGWGYWAGQWVEMISGKTHTFSARARKIGACSLYGEGGSDGVFMNAEYWDSDRSARIWPYWKQTNILGPITTNWQTFSLPFTPPAGCTNLKVVFLAYSVSGGDGLGAVFVDNATLTRTDDTLMSVRIGSTTYAPVGNSTNAAFYIDLGAITNVSAGNPLYMSFAAYDADSGLSRGTTDNTIQMNVDFGDVCSNDVAHFVLTNSTADADTRQITTSNTWVWYGFSAAEIASLSRNVTNRIAVTLFDADADRPGDRLSVPDSQYGYMIVTSTAPSYLITATTGSNGTITPAGVVVCAPGVSTTFVMQASADSHVALFTVDGQVMGPYPPGTTEVHYTFANIADNHAIDATFNHRPLMGMAANPTSGVAPLRVAVDFSASSDPDGSVVRSVLDKEGDGIFETEWIGAGIAIVDYAEPGVYFSTGRVYDAYGAWDEDVVRIEVLGRAPTAILSASPTNGAAPLSVVFVGTNSFAATNHHVVVYEWDLNGDGTFDRITSTGVVGWTYSVAGTNTAILRVTDDLGLKDSDSIQIVVASPVLVPPTVTLTASTNIGTVPLDVQFVAAATDDVQVVSFLWDFDGDGSVDLVTTNGAAAYRYVLVGSFQAEVTVVDNDGLTARDVATVQVVEEVSRYRVWLTQPKEGDRIWGDAVTVDGHVAPADDTVSVQFQYRLEGSPTWVPLGSPVYPQPRDYKTTWNVASLADGSNYQLRALAFLASSQVATSDVYTIAVDSSAGKTPGKVVEQIVSGLHQKQETFDKDQSAEVQVYDGTTVLIPAGTVSSNTTVEIVLIGGNTNEVNGSAQGQASIDANRRVSLEDDPELARTIIMIVPYADDDQDGIVDGTAVPESTLTVHWFDPVAGQWKRALSSEVRADENTVKAEIYHLTEFGLFGSLNLLHPAVGGVLESATSEFTNTTRAVNLTDGNTVSYWRSQDLPATNQVFVYSFTNLKGGVLSKVLFHNYGEADQGRQYYSRDFLVQTSMDRTNYITVASGTLLAQESPQEFVIQSTTCRTIRLVISSGTDTQAWEMAEFAAHGTLTDDPDGDGMPDAWEVQYFGDFSRNGTNDYDDDELSDQGEYARHTRPDQADTDGDLMADGWEVRYGFDPLSGDGGLDPDGDRQLNVEEFIAGTDPTNSTSVFTVQNVDLVHGTNCYDEVVTNEFSEVYTQIICDVVGYVLRWDGRPGRGYDVETSLDTSWQNVQRVGGASNLTAGPILFSITNYFPGGQTTNGLYRTRVWIE